jgi:flagellar hook assembly protein FlgD
MKESLKLDAKLKIYDEMGSLVMDSVVNNSSDTIKFRWDGRNKSGRLVGAGTYVGILEAKDLNPLNKVTLDAPPRFLIGVKR